MKQRVLSRLSGVLMVMLAAWGLAACSSGQSVSGQCKNDSGCAADQRCADGACVPREGYCESIMDCPIGYGCRDHQCVSLTPDGDTDVPQETESAPEESDESDDALPPVDGDDETDMEEDQVTEDDVLPDLEEDSATTDEPEESADETDPQETDAETDAEPDIEADAEAETEGDSEVLPEVEHEGEQEPEVEADPDPASDAEPEAEADSDTADIPAEAEQEVEEGPVSCGDIGQEGVCLGDVLYWCMGNTLKSEDCAADGLLCEYWESAGIYACLGGDGAPCGSVGDPECAPGYQCQDGFCTPEETCTPGAEACRQGDAYRCSNQGRWVLKDDCTGEETCEVNLGVASCVESQPDGDLEAETPEAEEEGIDQPETDETADLTESGENGESEGCGEVTYEGLCQGNVLVYCYEGGLEYVDCGAEGMVCEDMGGGDYWCASLEGGYCDTPPPIYCHAGLTCYNHVCQAPDACTTRGYLADGVTSGDTASGTNIMNPSCITSNARGNEALYLLHVGAREWVQVDLAPVSSGDPVLYALSQCNQNSCLVGADDNSSGSSETIYLGSETPGDIIIGADKYNAGTYRYTLTVTRHKAQTCDNVTTISSNTSITGDMRLDFNDYGSAVFGSCDDGDYSVGGGYDHIYRIQRPSAKEADITVTALTSGDPVIFVLDACDPTVAQCGYSLDSDYGTSEELVVGTSGPTTFYIVVDNYNADEGYRYTLDVQFVDPGSGCAAFDKGGDVVVVWVLALWGVLFVIGRRRKVHP